MTRAFAYLRVSGKGQVDGDGFPRQLAAIKAYADSHGIKVAQVFRDEGVSGTKELKDRPALGALLIALHANGVKLVLIEKLDRLARDYMVQESIIAELRKHGFNLISVTEPDLLENDPSRKLMRQIFGGISEYDKTMTVLKLRGARMRMKAKTGRCEGAKPYGFFEGEASVIERMKSLRTSGMGFDRIAAKLNEEGIKPRRGTAFFGITVNKILSRESTH